VTTGSTVPVALTYLAITPRSTGTLTYSSLAELRLAP
jgi:hypothetical protein